MMNRNSVLLLLTILAGSTRVKGDDIAADDTRSSGPTNVVISGPGVVTVGIPYGFSCTADCYPSCSYTWKSDGKTVQGAELDILLKQLVGSEVLTCEAKNTVSGQSATVTRSLLVTQGPSDVEIAGVDLMVAGTSSKFSCSASCHPDCQYYWNVDGSEQSEQSSEIEITAQQWMLTVQLICKAWNDISMLFAETVKTIQVADGPTNTEIVGPSAVKPGTTYTFLCLAYCIPSCSFTWSIYGKTYNGDKLVLTVEATENSETLTCIAENTLSRVSVTVKKTIPLTDPISVQPASVLPPTDDRPFSLNCIGAGPAASVQWLRNNHPVMLSDRVTLSTSNTTLSFSPVLRSDGGFYQCSVIEGAVVTPSLEYHMVVNYGPLNATIVEIGGGPVGSEISVAPGSWVTLKCVAECHPACSYTWLLGELVQQGDLLSLTPVNASDSGALTCLSYNTVTFSFTSVTSTVIVN
ncbi:cell adhesion molecule CEACAM1-like [Paramormyrops kingsleyae]|uniref:cell adhesion molecule CEACAM1-like n=1 Tax=Paramormyrops kingsleyae TaxID=1676925 RepID=UPI003B96F03B